MIEELRYLLLRTLNICGKTCAYFGKNVCVFAEIRLRFCGNKFESRQNARHFRFSPSAPKSRAAFLFHLADRRRVQFPALGKDAEQVHDVFGDMAGFFQPFGFCADYVDGFRAVS